MKKKTRITTRIFGLMLAVCMLVAALPLLPTMAEANSSANYHPVDLSGMYNLDVFGYSTTLDKTGSDNEWAELLIVDGMSQELTLGGVPYALGPFADGQYNAMCTNGADWTAAVEPGKYTTLNVLYAMSGNLVVPVVLTYSDGSSETVSLGDFSEGGVIKCRDWSWEVNDPATDDPMMTMTATFCNNHSSSTKYVRGNTVAVNSEKILTGITVKENGNGEDDRIMAMTLCGEPVDYIPLNLSSVYNMDTFKLSAESKDSSKWWSYFVGETEVAELTNPTFNGVPYVLGSFADGQNNALCADGADVSVPMIEGNYYTLHLLYASEGRKLITLKLTYSDNTSETVSVGDSDEGGVTLASDWGSKDITTDPILKKLFSYGQNDDPNQNFDGEKYIRSGLVSVDGSKVLTGITMVNENVGPYAWIMAMTLGKEKYNYVPQDLTDDYNMDTFKYSAESKDSTNWWSFVIDQGNLTTPTFGGVPYVFGSFDDGQNNALCANGADASVALDVGNYDGMYVLYTVSGGNREVPLQLTYSDGSSETVALGDFNDGGVIKCRDWSWDGTTADPIIQKVEAYGKNDNPDDNYDGQKYIRSGLIPVDSSKLLTGMTMVNNGNATEAWIMAITLRGEKRQFKVTSNTANGTVSVDKQDVKPGDRVEVTVQANDGYVLKNGLLTYRYSYNGNDFTAPLYKRINSAVYGTGEYNAEPDNVFILTVPAIHTDVEIITDFVPANAADEATAADNAMKVFGASYRTDGNPGLQFGSRVLTTVQVNGVTYELEKIGTLLMRGEDLGQPTDGQSWADYVEAEGISYRDVPASKLMDLCDSYVDYSVRLVNMGGKEDAKYAAVAYATYRSADGQELTLESGLSKVTSLNELLNYKASLS